MKYNSIKPGEIWLDTGGKPIQAHGASVFFENGVYYWYGENKEPIDGKSGYSSWGIRCYTSTDLYNWEDKGLIIPPDLENENSPLSPFSVIDRPHIIYNKTTEKYVCWFKTKTKVRTKGKAITYTVMISDNILGPYEFANVGISPLDMTPGDFDLAVASDGKAYIYYSRVWSEMICADLTSDYTDVNGYYSAHFPNPHPPFCREAPSHFIRNNKHYVITSGTTGYFPNPSEIAVADTWHGPYTVLDNPHPEDESNTSYHTQVSSVFKVHGKKDLYIACADRWVPEHMDVPYEFHKGYVATKFATDDKTGDKYIRKVSEEAAKVSGRTVEEEIEIHNRFRSKFARDYHLFNTSIARYVWLPIRFAENGNAYIDWKDEWKIEDYE